MLTEQNIEAELSYAYLHAIATRGGFSCTYTYRHLDNMGVDAQVHEDGRLLAPDSTLVSFALHVQLKATRKVPVEHDGKLSFSLELPQYNKLRDPRHGSTRILVVLYLPEKPEEWLHHSEDALVARRCAYWVSLRNAAESANEKYQTVYIPRKQILSVESLAALMVCCSREEELSYEP